MLIVEAGKQGHDAQLLDSQAQGRLNLLRDRAGPAPRNSASIRYDEAERSRRAAERGACQRWRHSAPESPGGHEGLHRVTKATRCIE